MFGPPREDGGGGRKEMTLFSESRDDEGTGDHKKETS